MAENAKNARGEGATNGPKTRKRRRRKDARPSEIIEAGLAEFAEKGFASTRLEDVARRADISKATIYLYFESKEALFEAAARSRSLQVIGSIEDAVDGFEGSTVDLIRLMMRMAYQGMLRDDVAQVVRLIVTEGPHAPALVEFYHREALTKGLGVL
ncbi:MAG: helix-turn-helix domain-containing protein, partial [Pseudomonadota bacterium]